MVVTLAVLHLATRGRGDPSGRLGPRAREGSARQQARLVGAVALIGLLDIGASLLYALGTSRSDDVGLQIIASACPVATVLLAQIVLRERMNRIQTAGVWLTIGAVLLIGGG